MIASSSADASAHVGATRACDGALQQPRSQGHQHPGGGAPDIALAVGNIVNIDGQLANFALARFVIGGIQYEVERHLEDVVHLRRGDLAADSPGSTKPTTGVTRKPEITT